MNNCLGTRAKWAASNRDHVDVSARRELLELLALRAPEPGRERGGSDGVSGTGGTRNGAGGALGTVTMINCDAICGRDLG